MLKKTPFLELRKHHCRGAEKTPRVWRKHLDAQKIPARYWENTQSLMLKKHLRVRRKQLVIKKHLSDAAKTLGCWKNTAGADKTPWMLRKPGCWKNTLGCWKSSWCWKNTFSMLKKSTALLFPFGALFVEKMRPVLLSWQVSLQQEVATTYFTSG